MEWHCINVVSNDYNPYKLFHPVQKQRNGEWGNETDPSVTQYSNAAGKK